MYGQETIEAIEQIEGTTVSYHNYEGPIRVTSHMNALTHSLVRA